MFLNHPPGGICYLRSRDLPPLAVSFALRTLFAIFDRVIYHYVGCPSWIVRSDCKKAADNAGQAAFACCADRSDATTQLKKPAQPAQSI